MKLKRVTEGYQLRYTHPITKQRRKHTFRIHEVRKAEKAAFKFLDGLHGQAEGLPDDSGWKMLFPELVTKFLDEAPISTETRRKKLRKALENNYLGVLCGADFTRKGTLTAKCQRLRSDRGDEFVRKTVQQPLKQVTAWAASIDLFPYDPLARWKRLPRLTEAPRKRAWSSLEMRAFLAACRELDALIERKFPTTVIFKALLITGNRPGAVLRSTVGSLQAHRIYLHPGKGKKRNGKAYIPPAFHSELSEYIKLRGNPGAKESLFVSPEGAEVDLRNLRQTFTESATLAAVRLDWPSEMPEALTVKPIEVCNAILKGKIKLCGAPPRTAEAIEKRDQKIAAIQTVLNHLKPLVETRLQDRPMYSFRKTHRTWAKQFVGDDAVRLQCGWASAEISEKHYLDDDFNDAGESAAAVWKVLIGELQLKSERLAGGGVLNAKPAMTGPLLAPLAETNEKRRNIGVASSSQVFAVKGKRVNAPWRTRTSDPVIKSHLLYQLS
jgi:integrase